ncbi:MAG: hypothetical protein ACI4V2_03765, partial [Alloprevotella sp.]
RASRLRNKAGNSCPYGSKGLNINKEGPVKGLLLYLQPKVKTKRREGKRQKKQGGVVGLRLSFAAVG